MSWIAKWIMFHTIKMNFRRYSSFIRFASKQCNIFDLKRIIYNQLTDAIRSIRFESVQPIPALAITSVS